MDLGLRGAGDVLGTRQHGLQELRVARLPEDTPLLERAGAWAGRLAGSDDALLRQAVEARFGPELEPIPA